MIFIARNHYNTREMAHGLCGRTEWAELAGGVPFGSVYASGPARHSEHATASGRGTRVALGTISWLMNTRMYFVVLKNKLMRSKFHLQWDAKD